MNLLKSVTKTFVITVKGFEPAISFVEAKMLPEPPQDTSSREDL